MARVGLAHTPRRDLADAEVLALVREACERAGGLPVRRGDMVVVKPNQTVWFPSAWGVTTDPRVVAALVTLSREQGARRVLVGDGSGGDVVSAHCMRVTGVARLAEKAGAEVHGFEDLPQRTVEVRLPGGPRSVPVPQALLDADCILDAPKAKTHFEDLISCALKNWVGIVQQDWRPNIMSDPLLCQVACALHQAVPARLHVVDGLWAGEGTGPVANTPAWLGCVVAGRDPVAVDATVARLLSLDPAGLVFAAEGARIGLGALDAEVVGPAVEDVRIRAAPGEKGFAHLPVRVLVGAGVTWAGTLGHFKSLADAFQRFGLWEKVELAYGKPTFMIGATDDPDFEAHVAEGPYFVLDSCARERYRADPRVTFVAGHPATHDLFSAVFRRLHVPHAGPAAMQLAQAWTRTEQWFRARTWAPEPR